MKRSQGSAGPTARPRERARPGAGRGLSLVARAFSHQRGRPWAARSRGSGSRVTDAPASPPTGRAWPCHSLRPPSREPALRVSRQVTRFSAPPQRIARGGWMQTTEQGATRSPPAPSSPSLRAPAQGPASQAPLGAEQGAWEGAGERSPGPAVPLPALSGLSLPPRASRWRRPAGGEGWGETGRGWEAVCRDLCSLGPRVPGSPGAASALVCIPGGPEGDDTRQGLWHGLRPPAPDWLGPSSRPTAAEGPGGRQHPEPPGALFQQPGRPVV